MSPNAAQTRPMMRPGLFFRTQSHISTDARGARPRDKHEPNSYPCHPDKCPANPNADCVSTRRTGGTVYYDGETELARKITTHAEFRSRVG